MASTRERERELIRLRAQTRALAQHAVTLARAVERICQHENIPPLRRKECPAGDSTPKDRSTSADQTDGGKPS